MLLEVWLCLGQIPDSLIKKLPKRMAKVTKKDLRKDFGLLKRVNNLYLFRILLKISVILGFVKAFMT